LRLSRASGSGKNVRSSLPSVLEERLPFFPEPKAFGSADGWPAEGRPAGGGAQEGIDGWRDGGKSAVSAIRRRRTLLCKNVGNGSSPNKGRQRADGRTVAREENLASQLHSNPEKGWVLKARSAKRPRSGRCGREAAAWEGRNPVMHVWGTVAGPGPECRAGRVGPGRGAGRADSESSRAAERPGGLRRDSPHPRMRGGRSGRAADTAESDRAISEDDHGADSCQGRHA